MFGKLSHEQRKALQNLIWESRIILLVNGRLAFLEAAGLYFLAGRLSLEADGEIFAGQLVREAERWGKDRKTNEYATVLLARYLRDEALGEVSDEARAVLDDAIAAYGGGSVPGPLRVLFLAANPDNTGKISFEKEYEAVTKVRDSLKDKSNVEVKFEKRVRGDDLIPLIRDYKPHILHFAGHGDRINSTGTNGGGNASARSGGDSSQWRGLFLVNSQGRPVEAPPDDRWPSGIILETDPDPNTGRTTHKLLHEEVLGDWLKAKEIQDHIRLVFLNACYAKGQADRIVDRAGVPFAVGMNEPINDLAAVEFAKGFYQILFDPVMSMETAFEQAKTHMKQAGYAAHTGVPYLRPRGDLRAHNYQIFQKLKAQ